MVSMTSCCALVTSRWPPAEPEPEAAGLDYRAASMGAFFARSALAVSTAEGRFWPPPVLDTVEVVGRAAGTVSAVAALISCVALQSQEMQDKTKKEQKRVHPAKLKN